MNQPIKIAALLFACLAIAPIPSAAETNATVRTESLFLSIGNPAPHYPLESKNRLQSQSRNPAITEQLHGRTMGLREFKAWQAGRWSLSSKNGVSGWWWDTADGSFLYPLKTLPYPDPEKPSMSIFNAHTDPTPPPRAPRPHSSRYPYERHDHPQQPEHRTDPANPYPNSWSHPTKERFPNSKFDEPKNNAQWKTVCTKRGFAPVLEDCRQVLVR